MAAKKPTVTEKLDEILAAVERMRQESAAKGVAILPDNRKLARDIPVGGMFRRLARQPEEIYRRVRFTGYLLNSTTISESLSSGKVAVLHTEQDTIFFIKGEETVIPL